MSTSPTVCITGGTGFIGAHVAASLIDRDCEVIVFDQDEDQWRLDHLGIGDEVIIQRGDIRNYEDILSALEAYEATHVIHLAAMPSNSIRHHPDTGIKVNIIGTTNLLEAVSELHPQIQRVVIASSESVYGEFRHTGNFPIEENAPVSPNSLYGATKAFNDQQAMFYQKRYELPILTIRPTFVYGSAHVRDAPLPDMFQSPSARFAHEIMQLIETGSGRITDDGIPRDWVHVSDVARMFSKAAIEPLQLSQITYHCATGTLTEMREVVDLLRAILPQCEINRYSTSDYEVDSVRALTPANAQKDIGFSATLGLEEGLRECVTGLTDL